MTTANLSEMFGLTQPQEFPSSEALAITLAMTYKRLGGEFSIASNGRRYVGRPFVCEHESEIPQLPDVKPHEQFLTIDQYEGGMRLLETLMHRLVKEDRNIIFDLLAPIAVDERGFAPSIEEPKRRQA